MMGAILAALGTAKTVAAGFIGAYWKWLLAALAVGLLIWFASMWVNRTIAAIEANAATAATNEIQPKLDDALAAVDKANAATGAANIKYAVDTAALIKQRDQAQEAAQKSAAAIATIQQRLKERPQDGGDVPLVLYDTLRSLH